MHSTKARRKWSAMLDAATEDDDLVVITRSGGKEPAVVISLTAYNSLRENADIPSTVVSARRLPESPANPEFGPGAG
ncbi:type II toxin-antitoxin system Phd/YefM family antitoxin [Nocardia takedensis]|uniref:type II toxin-antitoxin system Phd/YefM family antitoxin n=1 Tax=Nocardia takedensis TaxID=259390 RepID=UPI000A017890|nr:type II toxin-antitoxin system prevent-host-death family antitoxin [Nocardia takedensis]